MRRVLEFVAGLLEARRLAWLREIPSLRRQQRSLREESGRAKQRQQMEEIMCSRGIVACISQKRRCGYVGRIKSLPETWRKSRPDIMA